MTITITLPFPSSKLMPNRKNGTHWASTIKEPETVDDCVLRMDQLQEAPDIEYAHMEADRLLLKALSILARVS